jgi:hypothetical protein
VGPRQGKGKGGTFNARRAFHTGTGLGPAPCHKPRICTGHSFAPRIPPLQGAGAMTALRMP